ncbi:hypothetical protein MNBD_GAMMA21-2168 [hydrothermal vent metagenome]|uniref:Uncharacterized protein n=1 Tax=hydrothermal vent metagenome TaxID=652676 RepID=A0A3B1AXX4_9ZZZZ
MFPGCELLPNEDQNEALIQTGSKAYIALKDVGSMSVEQQ